MASGSGKGSSRGGSQMPVERAVSAGGIVYRFGNEGLEVAICGRDADRVWGLPKGTPDKGETLEETAVREVTEETGLDVQIVDKVGVVEYWFVRERVRFHKWVHYYLMESTGGDTSKHDREYDRVEWRSVEDAMKTLSFRNESEMVDKAQSMAESRT